MTFEVNPDYTGVRKPKVATIVYRIIGDPTAAVQAMENEEIDMIQPQATADILTQLEALADRGIEVDAGDGGTYEHVDLVFDNGGPFDPATYGGDEAKALAVRQAFLKTIPRQEIIDRLIVPLNPDADAPQLVHGGARARRATTPSSPSNGSAEYAEVDIEGAQALLEEAGVTTPIDVRFLYAANNPRRASRVRADPRLGGPGRLQRHRRQQPDVGPGPARTPTLYDASLFGWQIDGRSPSPTRRRTSSPTARTTRTATRTRTSTRLYAELKATTDAGRSRTSSCIEIERQLWADAFGVTDLPVPGDPGLQQTYVDGRVEHPAVAPTMFCNFWDWEAAS